ncbi:MAG TPA: TonB family protein [Burkholderiales bacterium]
MRDRSSRALQHAVLASLLAHGLLFVWFPHLRETLSRGVEAPAPLVAHLVEAPPAAVAAPPPEKPKPAPPPKPAPLAKAAPAAKPPPEPAATPTPLPAAPPAEASSAAPAQAAAAPAALQGADVPDADSLARFRLEIIEAAKKWKRYPRVAMDNNWEGRADVRITFNAEGRRAAITLTRSSGYDVLDQQALDMVTKAFVPVPAALRGREFTLEIPVIYSLEEVR